LEVNLYFLNYQTPVVPNAVLFAIFFLSGWLVGYMFNLFERFKAGKTIRNLRTQLDTQHNEINRVRRDFEALKPTASDSADVVQAGSEAYAGDATAGTATDSRPA